MRSVPHAVNIPSLGATELQRVCGCIEAASHGSCREVKGIQATDC